MKKHCPKCNKKFTRELSFCPYDGAPLYFKDTGKDLIGKEIDGRFKILKMIGEGGMGTVYLAKQKSMDRNVAIKIMRQELASEPALVNRFMTEVKAISSLRHPNTVTIHDFGQTSDGLLYFAMEYLEGVTLRDILMKDGALSIPLAMNIVVQVADSLSEAHRLGIIHRDLKPENIFITSTGGHSERGFIKVLDFGIARTRKADGESKITDPSNLAGTPHYMSPETIMGEQIDHRSDIYSLGIILYEMLAGVPPFVDEAPMKIMMKHLNEAPKPVSQTNTSVQVPVAIHDVMMKALSKDRELRPLNVSIFKDLLLNAYKRSGKEIGKTKTPTALKFPVREEPGDEQKRLVKLPTSQETASFIEIPKDVLAEVEQRDLFRKRIFLYGASLFAVLVLAGSVAMYFYAGEKSKEAKTAIGEKKKKEAVASESKKESLKVAVDSPDIHEGGDSATKSEAERSPETIALASKGKAPDAGQQHEKNVVEKADTAKAAEDFVNIYIESFPDKADIFRDSSRLGATPLNISMPRNGAQVELLIKKDDYREKTVKFTADKDASFSVELIKAGVPKISKKVVESVKKPEKAVEKAPKKEEKKKEPAPVKKKEEPSKKVDESSILEGF